MHMYLLPRIVLSCFFVLCSASVSAHGDLDERIKEATSQLENAPDSAYLHFYRGKLRYQHEQYEEALFDLNHAEELGYQDIQLWHFSARVNLMLGEYGSALSSIETVLASVPKRVTALKAKAQIYDAMGQFEDAARTYLLVIDHSIRTFPENYIDAAHAWLNSPLPEAAALAQGILDRGLRDLGSTPTLLQCKKDMYISTRDYGNALDVQQELISKSTRKEVPLYAAAELALLLGENKAAIAYLLKSRKAIFSLPSEIRRSTAMQLLENQTKIFLTQLNYSFP